MMDKLKKPLPDQLDISVFGPGYGECILIHIGNGAWIAIDCCQDPITREPVPLQYLKNLGFDPQAAVKYIIASHWHEDHVRGLHNFLQASTNARFSCASVLTGEEFFALAEIYNDPTSAISRNPKEIYNCLKTIEQRIKSTKQPIISWASADKVLCKTVSPYPVKLTSLSPSDAMDTRSKMFMFNYISAVKKGSTDPKMTATTPNDVAVAILFEINGREIILGSDLEEEKKSNPLFGWSAVLKGNTVNGTRSNVYKVAHHGSNTGHHHPIWTDILTDQPLALLTPFQHGKHKIPNLEERNTILALTNNAYISADPNHKIKAPKRTHKVQAVINGAVKNLRLANGKVGHIRWRASINDLSDVGSIELFDGALRLCDVAP